MAEVQNVIGNETVVLELTRKKDGVGSTIGKAFALIFGLLGIFTSLILFITIIGIVPGAALFYVSLGWLYIAIGKQRVACPHCKKKQAVLQSAENMTCPKCRKLTVINWK